MFQNSVYLMLSTLVQAVFGFGFWILNARLFSPEQIGLASTLISASTFIAYLAGLGFNSTFMRFLPTSKRRNDKLNTGLTLVLATALVMGAVYMWVVPVLTPDLAFMTRQAALAVAFVLLTAATAANLLTDSVFVAYRVSRYNFVVYAIQSVVKLVLPLALVGLGAYGVFAASGLAAAFALGLSIYFMVRLFGYRPRVQVDRAVVQQVWRFSSGSYLANLFNILPTLVMPMVVVNSLGAERAGYFYLAFMLANLVYAVVYAISQSLFAEGAHGEVAFHHLLQRAVGLLAAIIVPAAVGLAVLGPLVLHVFGKAYTGEAAEVLVMLAVAAPAVAAYVLGGVLLRMSKQNLGLVWTNALYALVTCGLAVLWAPRGLVWVAGAWLVGNVVTAIAEFAVFRLRRPGRGGMAVAGGGTTDSGAVVSMVSERLV